MMMGGHRCGGGAERQPPPRLPRGPAGEGRGGGKWGGPVGHRVVPPIPISLPLGHACYFRIGGGVTERAMILLSEGRGGGGGGGIDMGAGGGGGIDMGRGGGGGGQRLEIIVTFPPKPFVEAFSVHPLEATCARTPCASLHLCDGAGAHLCHLF